MREKNNKLYNYFKNSSGKCVAVISEKQMAFIDSDKTEFGDTHIDMAANITNAMNLPPSSADVMGQNNNCVYFFGSNNQYSIQFPASRKISMAQKKFLNMLLDSLVQGFNDRWEKN